jgi:hypothetical protein
MMESRRVGQTLSWEDELKTTFIAVCLCLISTAVLAGDRGYCTSKCGGKPGGEAANPPSVVACFRKCMGTTGNSDSKRHR